MVSAILLFTEYPRDMHCRSLSGSMPPPLSAHKFKKESILDTHSVRAISQKQRTELTSPFQTSKVVKFTPSISVSFYYCLQP